MKKALFLLLFFLSVGTVNAQSVSTLEPYGYSQGWLVPNDYTTQMNPPNCKLREPSEEETAQVLLSECSSPDCEDTVKSFAGLWSVCSEIGMSVRTVDGKQVAYFEATTTEVTPSPTTESTPMPTPEPETLTAPFPTVGERNTNRWLQTFAAVFSLLGGLAFAKGIFMSDKQAINLGTSKWSGNRNEENLQLPAVKDKIDQRGWGIIGGVLTIIGFIIQIISIYK